jgi:hypothetical protein
MLEVMAALSMAVWFNGKRRVSCRLHTPLCLPAQGLLKRFNHHYLVTFRVTAVVWVVPPPVALMVMV